jgi:hypothetical protein
MIPFPDTTGYVYLGTYVVTQPLPSVSSKPPKHHRPDNGLGGDENCKLQITICVWQKDNASIHIYQDLNTFTVTGSDSCTTLDTMSVSSIVGLLARDAVQEGVSRVLLPCSGNCLSQDSVTVWQSTCAIRTGTGASTKLIPSPGTGICFRRYTYCCPHSTAEPPVMVEQPAPLVTCPLGSNPTCKSSVVIQKPGGRKPRRRRH